MKKVTIVGVGALGSHVALLLRNEADLRLIDFDRVEQKNVLSQFHGRPSVGKNKAQALQQSLGFLFGAKPEAIPHRLTKDNAEQLLGDTNLIIDCLDNGEARRIIQKWIRLEAPFDSGIRPFRLSNFKASLVDGQPVLQATATPTTVCLHGALAADAGFGRVIWDEQFVIDDESGAGAATCQDGEHLPFIAIVAAYLAQAAKIYLTTDQKVGYQVHAGGATRI